MDIETLGSLILEELRLIRSDMKKEIGRLRSEIKIIHLPDAKKFAEATGQDLCNYGINVFSLKSVNSSKENTVSDELKTEFLADITSTKVSKSYSIEECRESYGENLNENIVGDKLKTEFSADITSAAKVSKNNSNEECRESFVENSIFIPQNLEPAYSKISHGKSNFIAKKIPVQSNNNIIDTAAAFPVVIGVNSLYNTNNLNYPPKSELSIKEFGSSDLFPVVDTCQDSTVLNRIDNGSTCIVSSFNSFDCSSAIGDFSQIMKSEESSQKYKCKICPKSFSIYSNYLIHINDHSGKQRFPCNKCNKVYSHKNALSKHKAHHNHEKQMNCTFCDKVFYNKFELRLHTRTHTGERPYKCSICNKSFIQSSNLNRHMRVHTGERPFTCNICNKSFARKITWSCHIRIHTGEKPFTCNICNKSFTHKVGLTAHKRIHTGEKPYTCIMCDNSFMLLSQLKRHMRVHPAQKTVNDVHHMQ